MVGYLDQQSRSNEQACADLDMAKIVAIRTALNIFLAALRRETRTMNSDAAKSAIEEFLEVPEGQAMPDWADDTIGCAGRLIIDAVIDASPSAEEVRVADRGWAGGR